MINHPDKITLLAMLRKFIAQRPGLEFGNYGDVSAYRSELRGITKDRHVAESMIRFCEWHDSITAENIAEGFRAFSGRLTLTQRADGNWALDYCTGQYWPTEYRRAVCSVLSSVIWDYYRSDVPKDGPELSAFLNRNKSDNPGDYLRRTCAREFGRTVGRRFFS